MNFGQGPGHWLLICGLCNQGNLQRKGWKVISSHVLSLFHDREFFGVCHCKPYSSPNRFRTAWPVERVGKWRELDYTAPVYPSFACGAGNVLSADLVRWLAVNADNLKPYQVVMRLINILPKGPRGIISPKNEIFNQESKVNQFCRRFFSLCFVNDLENFLHSLNHHPQN